MKRKRFHALAAPLIALAIGAASAAAPEPTPDAPTGVVRLAMVRHAGGLTGRCFSTQFLSLLAYETNIQTDRSLAQVDLDSPELFSFPLAILTGEGEFALSATERSNLRRYILAGGTMLISSGCSNELWAASMRRELEAVFPAATMTRLTPDHELFHIVFDVGDLVTTKGGEGELWGLHVEDRLAIVFSPHGLNDTAGAGGGCCCCGGNEIREAKFINANLVAYALTR